MAENVLQLSLKWDQQTGPGIIFKKPRVLLAMYMGNYYITIDDHESVFFFVSALKLVHACVAFKCHETKIGNDGVSIYNITEPGALQVISCSSEKVFNPLSAYVNDNLRSIIFG